MIEDGFHCILTSRTTNREPKEAFMAGEAQSNAFMLGSATVMLGAPAEKVTAILRPDEASPQ